MTLPKFLFFKELKTNTASTILDAFDHKRSFSGFHFLWMENENLFVTDDGDCLTVSYMDQVVGAESEIIRWHYGQSTLHFERPWPGRTAMHYSNKTSLTLSSHLCFFNQLGTVVPTAPKMLPPDTNAQIDLISQKVAINGKRSFNEDCTFEDIEDAAIDLDAALYEVMANTPSDTVILLSGGIDSAGLASMARHRNLPCLTWVLADHDADAANMPDVQAALEVADHCGLKHEILKLDAAQLSKDVEAAVFLSEIKRGTLIDDMVVYLQVARHLQSKGIRYVVLGEAADDAFGCLPMNFRFYQGEQLLQKLRGDLLVGAPDDYAAISKLFDHFGIAVIDPYLSKDVAKIGASLPLNMRISEGKTIKPVIRAAFAQVLPSNIVRRKKEVSRDVSGIREEMHRQFGDSQYRFYAAHKALFRSKSANEYQEGVLRLLD